MKINRQVLFMGILFSLTMGLQAISSAMVHTCAAAFGLLPARLIYGMIAKKNRIFALLMSPLVGIASGLTTHRFLYKFTACGKIEAAEHTMRAVRHYLFARESFDTDDDLLQEVFGLYVSQEWPLIEACNDLMSHRDASLQAIEMAQDSQQEDSIYAVRAERVKQVMYAAIENMNRAIRYIRAHKDYSFQLGKFRELHHQKELVKAQQSAMIAQWFNVALQVVDLWLQWSKAPTPQQTTSAVVPAQQQEIQGPHYESESCCVCLEDFAKDNNPGVQRIILRPCGHDICKTCAHQLFFGAIKAKTCPTCRTKVDLDRLKMGLQKKR